MHLLMIQQNRNKHLPFVVFSLHLFLPLFLRVRLVHHRQSQSSHPSSKQGQWYDAIFGRKRIYQTLIQTSELQSCKMINISETLSDKTKINQSSIPLGQNKKLDQQFINGHGVHGALQLFLIAILIISSISLTMSTHKEIRRHDRYLRTYLNLNLLGKNDLGLYEQGLNIDESEMEFVTITQIQQHFQKTVNISRSLLQDGIVLFKQQNTGSLIELEIQRKNNSFQFIQFRTVEEAISYFNHFQLDFLRSLLLPASQLKLTIRLGDNKFLENYTISSEYRIHSNLMIEVTMDCVYDLRDQRKQKIDGLRIIEQIIAFVLFAVYTYQIIKLTPKLKTHRLFTIFKNDNTLGNIQSLVKKYRGWYFFLILMCLITLFNEKYSPICCFLQLLPIFQFPQRQQKQKQIYNFNKNLRFSFKLIMSVFFPMFIFLNGFIFFSMLMYPGDYFDDYSLAFFSYVYQLFQVGSYEVFIELKQYGHIAHLFYAVLYFYVFMVGNILITALFVSLIDFKINERFTKLFVQNIVHDAACPMCLEKNSHELASNKLELIVTSSRISPLMSRRNLQKPKAQTSKEGTAIMLYIEDQQNVGSPSNSNQRFHKNIKFSNLSTRILNKVRKLERQIFQIRNKQHLERSNEKIINYCQNK